MSALAARRLRSFIGQPSSSVPKGWQAIPKLLMLTPINPADDDPRARGVAAFARPPCGPSMSTACRGLPRRLGTHYGPGARRGGQITRAVAIHIVQPLKFRIAADSAVSAGQVEHQSLTSTLKFLFESESADRILKFLRTRREHARIIAPAWVRELVTAGIPLDQRDSAASWSESIGNPDPKADGIWNYIVIAPDADREQALVADLNLRGGLKVFGLLGQVLPALLCNVNGFARGRSARGLKRYALLCVPRSGSRYLSSMLDRQGLGAPQEHLRDPLAVAITDGKFGYRAAVEALERYGQRNGIFGTKLISTFLLKACRSQLSEVETNLAWMRDRGYHLLYITRPLNETVISSYIAMRLNKWHFFGEIDQAAKERLDEMAFDRRAVWDEYVRFRAQKALMDHVARRFAIPSFSYSEIQSNVDRIVSSVCTSLKVDAEHLKTGAAAIPVATRRESGTYESFASSLDELLEERRSEILPNTTRQLQILAGLGPERAGGIATAIASA